VTSKLPVTETLSEVSEQLTSWDGNVVGQANGPAVLSIEMLLAEVDQLNAES
jgi:hypothetical protein